MRRIKRRVPADVARREARHRRQSWTRWLYLAVVLGVFVWIADLFVGSYIFFRSDGMVLAEHMTVAIEYPARVDEVLVREGDFVEAGSTVAVIRSQQVTESVARLTSEFATHRTRLAELRIRRRVIEAMTSIASKRARVARETRQEFERLHEKGLLPLNKRAEAIDLEYRSLSDLESLTAEKGAIDAELAELTQVLKQAEGALADLRAIYLDGRLTARKDSIVGRLHVSEGAVIRPGEPLMDLYAGARYVLAYVPTGALYSLAPGDRVTIRYGLHELGGTIERVEPVAAALPREFQKAFRPAERAQLARITLDPDAEPPPLFSKVRVSSRY